MSDRELLELAAKAAGIFLLWGGPDHDIPIDAKKLSPWNPLTDDGDALRLAVRLKLCFGPNFDGDSAVCFGCDGDNIVEPFGVDIYSATRRAIVRAAAEIGRQMQEGGAA